MLCYRDRTFCASPTHKGCGREITEEEKAKAKRIGLPIAFSYFCGGGDVPLEERLPENK